MAQIVLDTQNGLTIPALTTAQKNAIASPNTGALVYDTTLGAVSDYNGSSWDVATVLSQFANSLGAVYSSGYQKFPNGLIIQWGGCATGSISFPITFPNSCIGVYFGPWQGTSTAQPPFIMCLTDPGPTTTGFIAAGYNLPGLGSSSQGCFYAAIGN